MASEIGVVGRGFGGRLWVEVGAVKNSEGGMQGNEVGVGRRRVWGEFGN